MYISSTARSIVAHRITIPEKSPRIFHPGRASSGFLFKKSDFRLTYTPGLRSCSSSTRRAATSSRISTNGKRIRPFEPIDPLYLPLLPFLYKKKPTLIFTNTPFSLKLLKQSHIASSLCIMEITFYIAHRNDISGNIFTFVKADILARAIYLSPKL